MNNQAGELRGLGRLLAFGVLLCRCASGAGQGADDSFAASGDGRPAPGSPFAKADAGANFPVVDASTAAATESRDGRAEARVETSVDADSATDDSAEASADASADVVPEARGASVDGAVDAVARAPEDAAPDSMRDAALACNASADPKDSPCVIDDAYGVFVSGSGADSAAGTMADPLKSISAGVAQAAQVGKTRVYVCRGAYADSVVLDARHNGIQLYGGFACVGGWKWTGEKAEVQSPASHYALRVDSTTKPTLLQDIGFTAADGAFSDADSAGDSSIAAFVRSAAPLTLIRVHLQAGAGASGRFGGPIVSNDSSGGPIDLAGNAGMASGSAGATKSCVCTFWGYSAGGAGGTPSSTPGGDGLSTPATVPDLQLGLDGLGGGALSPLFLDCLPGDPGANGSTRTGGGQGAQILGLMTSGGWSPASGTNGLAGNPGQGGGGGATDSFGFGDTGGGGACGGCGGAGGNPGQGGGGSIAALVYDSTVTLRSSVLVTSTGGIGGPGRIGEHGVRGGIGGTGGGGCAGGAGGSGAGGGGGGGGAGGVSVGILSNVGSIVNVDATTTIAPGPAGRGGFGSDGGLGGNGAPPGERGTGGLGGVSLPLLSL